MKKSNSFDTLPCILIVVISIFLCYVSMSCSNQLSNPKWNNGICPTCNEYYELRAVYRYSKFYVCPICHTVVERY